MNALHKYVVREMSAQERRDLMAMEAMLCEAIRDTENEIRQASQRLQKAKAKRAEIRKQLEQL